MIMLRTVLFKFVAYNRLTDINSWTSRLVALILVLTTCVA